MSALHYTVAHISDLHLSPEYYPERSFYFREALRQCRDRNVDHIVITGDITNQARLSEFEEFRTIAQEYGVLDSRRLSVVAGNHDIYGGPYTAEEVLEFPSVCKSTHYEEKMKEFHRLTSETFSGVERLSGTSVFPYIKTIGPVALIGLNSIARWSSLGNPLGSNGEIDNGQFELLASALPSLAARRKRIIVLIHHHFNKQEYAGNGSKLGRLWNAIEAATMKMRKKKRLLRLFARNGVEAVLHGHVHRNGEYIRKRVRCLNAGGSIVPANGVMKSFHILTVAKRSIDVSTIPLKRLPAVSNLKRTAAA